MTAQTFRVDGLDGITFTPTYDVEKAWLVIEGYDRDGNLISRSGLSVTPDPIADIAITPEPNVPLVGAAAPLDLGLNVIEEES